MVLGANICKPYFLKCFDTVILSQRHRSGKWLWYLLDYLKINGQNDSRKYKMILIIRSKTDNKQLCELCWILEISIFASYWSLILQTSAYCVHLLSYIYTCTLLNVVFTQHKNNKSGSNGYIYQEMLIIGFNNDDKSLTPNFQIMMSFSTFKCYYMVCIIRIQIHYHNKNPVYKNTKYR